MALDANGFVNRCENAAPEHPMELLETQSCVRQAIEMLDEERRVVVIMCATLTAWTTRQLPSRWKFRSARFAVACIVRDWS